MTLEERITADMKTAMKAKDRDALEAIRSIRAAIINAKTEVGSGGTFKDEDGMKLLQKLKKQRDDAAAIYREQNRADLAEVEEMQAKVIEGYLPEMMSAEELEAAVKDIITSSGATGMGDMGKVMGMASSTLAGKAEGKAIAGEVRKQLQSL
ncbi:GatB/YqeY domain-containing protein [Phaeocystidibacter marisrubri]|uniref:GatB/YqeY domain-containing protein n=1 Tax=Phaeocystidibacter marisrubri TaxID=1577780 RepID=A0A6L3ZE35_9FLAO|nr:GatB/YqeY domain-containing protein [Phaeocystidibacter marisrubri]KAB2816113.1 GatB/YqeY domain-containing protein [Phaeocystidibacter marisrubri]GGH67391.1 aspartyl-tRNA amidotransferase subunit B [Phaeocystidibacter marisrubri]